MAKAVLVGEEVEIPPNVNIEIDGMKVRVKGPKGTLERDFSHARGVQIYKEDNKIVVELKYDQEKNDEAQEIGTNLPFRLTKNSKYVTGIEKFYEVID